MAGVIPVRLGLAFARCNKISPKVSCHFFAGLLGASILTNLEALCHLVCSCSAGGYPFPLMVFTWSNLGPFVLYALNNAGNSSVRLWPSTGPL